MRNDQRCNMGHYRQQQGFREQRGFTLIELMTVIVLVSVLVAMAGPAFTGAIDRSKIRSTSADLMASLSGTRSRALAQNTQMIALPYAGTTSWHTASGTAHPNGGWCVMKVNLAAVQTACAATTATVSGVTSSYPMYETHEVDKNVTVVSSASSLIFKGDGTLNSAALVTFTVCKTGQLGNVITVGLAGRITTDPTAAVCP